MMHTRTHSWISLMVCTATAGLVTTARAGEHHHHEGDFVIGQNAQGRLAFEVPDVDHFELLPVSGLLNGWLGDDPGFTSLEEDEPDEGFFQLDPGAQIALELLSIDPGFKIWTPGFAEVLDEAGDQWILGGLEIHTHPEWHVDSTDPLFDPLRPLFSATFRVIDLGTTGYDPSDPVVATFAPVPEPATVLLLALGSACALCGRRRGLRPGKQGPRRDAVTEN